MPNPYFQFKKFTVYHDRCAMKVGTDGVLLGAWCDISNAYTALDIGTGTGLIALMMVQRNLNMLVDAIDIYSDAIAQAEENIKRSPFSSSIKCSNLSLESFYKQCPQKYDVIVSNPPFFIGSLKSPKQNRTLARHTDSLQIEELINISAKLVTDKGRLSVIYPYEHKDVLLHLAKENELFVSRITNVYPTPAGKPKRVLMEFSKADKLLAENDLIIEKERHIYSDGFTALVKDFYMKL